MHYSFIRRPRISYIAGGAAALLVLCVAIVLAFHAHISNPPKQTNPQSSAGQSTKGEKVGQSTSNTPSTTTSNNVTPGSTKNDTAPITVLIQPFGDFVSAHKSVSVNTALSSVCNTSAGAQCQISYTSGSTTLSLPFQTTDAGGATYWNSWTPSSIGLTPGTWQIKATARLGSQSKSSTDALNLEVVQ